MDRIFDGDPAKSSRRFTFVVPSNAAWERVQLDFSKAYNTLVEGQFPNYVSVINVSLKKVFQLSGISSTHPTRTQAGFPYILF